MSEKTSNPSEKSSSTGAHGKDRVEPRKLKGFRDYSPEIMAERMRILDIMRDEAQRAGFQQIATPALEYLDTLLGQGEDTEKEMYRFVDHGGRHVGLRFDLTVPFARYVAEHQGSMVFPFKRLQVGEVWRGENPQKGRFREFVQSDLDIIGVDSIQADVEVLTTLHRILARLNIGPFTMLVGNRPVLSAMIRKVMTYLAPEQEQKAIIAIDKLNKIGPAKVEAMLAALPGGSSEQAASLMKMFTTKAACGDTDFKQLEPLFRGDEAAMKAIKRFHDTVVLYRQATKGLAGQSRVDLAVARGLGYYTGVVFEAVVDELPGFGSISGGGRYDDLVSRFIDRQLQGVGGTIGLDRIVALQEERRALASSHCRTVFVACAGDDAAAYAWELTVTLRDAGVSCDIALSTGKVGNQFRHASRLGYPFVLMVGGDEVVSRTFSIKNMATSDEKKGLAAAQVLTVVQDALKNLA